MEIYTIERDVVIRFINREVEKLMLGNNYSLDKLKTYDTLRNFIMSLPIYEAKKEESK